MNHEILSELNPAQKEAVSWENSPLLIIAGAGSGKTRILTRRIAYKILQGVPSFQILGVTFTNKAAREMKLRVEKLTQQDVWISTFHSTCMRILRMDGPAIGLDRQFSIYDDQDQLSIIKECLKELNLNEKQVHPKGVKERIQRAKDLLITPRCYAEQSQEIYEDSVAKIYALYEQKLSKLKACDFGDLIMKTVLLFEQVPPVLKTWQDRFQHILVDEYQDTNHAQYRFLKALAVPRHQITVVGDPDQSIYAWRGADIRNILNFEKDYPDCGIIRMEQNYRSTGIILDAANELISRNKMRKPKSLWTERKEGEKITLYQAFNEKDEAQYVVQKVLEFTSKGKTFADQVVFYRVHAQSRVVEDALRRAKIPYKIVGGVRFYDRKEIKDIIAYMKILANPYDEVSLKRVINVPTRGIGKKAIESIEAFALSKQSSLYEALHQIDVVQEMTPKSRRSIKSFLQMIKILTQEINHLSVRMILEAILEKTRYVEMLEAEKSMEAHSRIENLEEFFSVVDDFEQIPLPNDAISSLQAFLESISLTTDLDGWDAGTNVLTLMTLHTAKGLEFPIVYMMGLEEGIFPNVNSYTADEEDLEEERRLCYVGFTRAKDKLLLSFARERLLYGSRQHNLASRFLNEISSDLYESHSTLYACESFDNSFDDLDEDPFLKDDEPKTRIYFD